jgi:hypothetical protein
LHYRGKTDKFNHSFIYRYPASAWQTAMSLRSDADRNLLFGILAVQMDFVSRDALIQAMNAWVLEKHKPLGQILQDQGSLASSRRALLEALVSEHLKQHDNDPQKSLASLSSVGSVKQQLSRATGSVVTPAPPGGG